MSILVYMLSLSAFTETKAAKYAAAMVKRTDRAVWEWRKDVIENDGVVSESQQGRYQRSGLLWQNEELNKKAIGHV